MLFETLSQPQIFWFLALIGFLSGFIFDISGYIVFLCKKNKIVKIILDFLASLTTFFVFYLAVSKIDFGAVRAYHLLAFLSSFSTQRISLGNIIAKLFDWCYNLFTKIIQKIFKRQPLTKDDETTKPDNSI